MGKCIACEKKTDRKLLALWGRGVHADLKEPILVCSRKCELDIMDAIKEVLSETERREEGDGKQ